MRLRTSHAAKSGVGEHTARESEAPNVCASRRREQTRSYQENRKRESRHSGNRMLQMEPRKLLQRM